MAFYLPVSCNLKSEKDSLNNSLKGDSNYTTFNLPLFKTVKILSLKEDIYSNIPNLKKFDSLVKSNILIGDFTSFTFLDSLGRPLSKYYDSLTLNSGQKQLLLQSLEKCYSKGNHDFPKCGSRIQDAIIFYDSLNNPEAFIELSFDCSVYSFSDLLKKGRENCNSDSMINSFLNFFNSVGIKRNLNK